MGYGSAVALGRALEYVNELGVDRVLAHDQALAARLADGLRSLGATVLTPEDDAHRGGIVTARYPGRDGEEVAGQLNDAGVIVSPRFGATRFSLHYFNDERDVDAALHVLATLLTATCLNGCERLGSRLLNSRAIESIYGLLGVRPVINAAGIYTDLGGSVLSPTVRDAVHEANGTFASMTELLDRSGERIADLLGVEAARVVPGASAGIALSVGACMTRADGHLMEQLPTTAGMRSLVLMQPGHHYKYDRCARMTGAHIVEGDLSSFVDVACVLHPAHLDGSERHAAARRGRRARARARRAGRRRRGVHELSRPI